MPGVTRVGDHTTGQCDLEKDCCPHDRTGTNDTASPNVYANGRAIHRITDTGPTNCPHAGTFKSTAGSSTVFVNGLSVTRMGDATVCDACGQGGAHSTGSGNVIVGG